MNQNTNLLTKKIVEDGWVLIPEAIQSWAVQQLINELKVLYDQLPDRKRDDLEIIIPKIVEHHPLFL